MSARRRSDGPTDKQVAVWLAFVEHRNYSATARALGTSPVWVRYCVRAFLARCRNIR